MTQNIKFRLPHYVRCISGAGRSFVYVRYVYIPKALNYVHLHCVLLNFERIVRDLVREVHGYDI